MRKTSGVATVSGRSVSGGAQNLPPCRERYPGATPEERRLLNANQRSFYPGSSGTKSVGEVVTRAAVFARICISHGAVRTDAPISRVQTQPFSWIGKQYGVTRDLISASFILPKFPTRGLRDRFTDLGEYTELGNYFRVRRPPRRNQLWTSEDAGTLKSSR